MYVIVHTVDLLVQYDQKKSRRSDNRVVFFHPHTTPVDFFFWKRLIDLYNSYLLFLGVYLTYIAFDIKKPVRTFDLKR